MDLLAFPALMVKYGMEITAHALKICTGMVIAVSPVLQVKYGQSMLMPAVAPEENIGMDFLVSLVMEEDHGIPQLTVAHVPTVRIGMELSVSLVPQDLNSMVSAVLHVIKEKFGILQIWYVSVLQVSNGMEPIV